MNLKEAENFQRRTGLRPKDTIIGVDAPMEIGEVMLLGRERLRVEAQITREEFMTELERHRSKPDWAVGTGTMSGAKVTPDDQHPTEPPTDCTFFYRMARIE